MKVASTKAWLDDRFRKTDSEGIYLAHQPIYGFREGHCEPALVERYIRTLELMSALSLLTFETLLDVGAAEGYKAALAKTLFGCSVRAVDLSSEACKRASEIYGIESSPGDVHSLPFRDNEFDVTICSETLEHVEDAEKAISELIRVTRNAVVVTVPHDTKIEVDDSKQRRVSHGHIQVFDLNSFDYLRSAGFDVRTLGIFHPITKFLGVFADAIPRNYDGRENYPKWTIDVYNRIVPILRIITGKTTIRVLISGDQFLRRVSSTYRGILVMISKTKESLLESPRVRISIDRIMNFTVPYHYMQPRKSAT